MFGVALSLYPRCASKSSSLSGVTATAESTPGSSDTVIFPPEEGGESVCVVEPKTQRRLCVCLLQEGERKGKRLKENVRACVCLLNIPIYAKLKLRNL